MRFEEYQEMKKKEKLFNEKKRKYENEYYDDGERYTLCYSFEDEERQKEISSKLFDNVLKLYKFTKKKYVNGEKSVSNEGHFDTNKVLDFIDSHFDKDFEECLKYYKCKF